MSVEYKVPALFHALDDAWNVGCVVLGGGISDGTSLSDEVTADDSVQLGAVWIVLVDKLRCRKVIAVIVFDIGALLQERMRFLEHFVEKVVGKQVVPIGIVLE